MMLKSMRNLYVFLMLLVLVGLGATGFHVIEGWNWDDSIYMTLMVLTTVGFGEVHPLTTAGKIYTDVVMVVGIGLMLYLLSLLAEGLVRGVFDPALAQRRKEKRLLNLKNHTVVCGYGQVGEAVCSALAGAGRKVVVIDNDSARLEWASTQGLLTLQGDATDEDVLRRAGIEHAQALVTVIGSDPANLYVVLSAKGLFPDLRVIVRASDESAARKMRRAGAEEVVNPYQLSGNRIAGMMLAPNLARFLNGGVASEHFTVREVTLPAGYVGRMVSDLGRETGALVVAIWREGQPLKARSQEGLQAGDTLLLAGANHEVEAVEGWERKME